MLVTVEFGGSILKHLSSNNSLGLISRETAFLQTTTTNFINKQIILQRHCPQLARLFEAAQCVQIEIKIKAN